MDVPSEPSPPGVDPQRGAGRLVVVATPIGNLGDLSPRAAQALEAADLVAAEDTRRTRILLEHLGLVRPMTSYHDHNEQARAGGLLDRVEQGQTVVLVSDAGTPGIADPGFVAIREAIRRDLPLEAVPGPSAALHALLLSGLPMDRFVFEGFLPRKAGARARRLEELRDEPRTMIFYAAPHRAADDLIAMAGVLGEREAAMGRELTKLHEDVVRATLPRLADIAHSGRVRGEVTLVVAGAPQDVAAPEAPELAALVREQVDAGLARKEAIARVAGVTGLPKKVVYQAVLDHPSEPGV